jgi:hypothetical protein
MNSSNAFRVIVVTFAFCVLALLVLLSERKVSASPPAESSVTGVVKLDGAAPHQRPINMSKEPYCDNLHKASPVSTETVVAGPDGGLRNVVVYISQGWSGPDQPESDVQNWDQKGCQYIPHVMALDVNQHFRVVNSDPTSHNIHPMPQPGTANHEWNKSQPPGAPPIDTSWAAEEVAIHVKCNIHPWMSGYMVVVKGPYGVSDDKGEFKIAGVPPGNYTLTAWQETYGTQTQKITVAAGKPTTANFTFKAK